MFELIVYIRPAKLDAVLQAIAEFELSQVTFAQVRGYGRQKGHLDAYKEAEEAVVFLPKVRVALVVADPDLEPMVEAITTAARTGRIGDGKILLLELAEAVA